MSDKNSGLRGSEKTLRYLDDATDAAARQEILDEAQKSGLTDAALPLISHKTVFHTSESLSPVAGMAIDKRGRLVVSDEFNHRLIVYDDSGKQLQEVGKQGSGDMEFHYPRGLCFDDDGNLYVADAWNHRIAVLAPDLSFKGSIGTLGSGDGELDEPVGVVWSSGRLAVLEKSNHRIQLFSGSVSMGTISMGTIGTRGSVAEQEQFYLLKTHPEEFCTPVFEFPTAIAADSGGNHYVADTNNHRIVKVDGDSQYDSSYAPSGLRHPTGLSVDKNDNLHVTQFNRGSVRVFSPEGILLYGYTPSGIELPVAIVLNGSSIYVGGGMKASISVNRFDPEHDATLARENDFSLHFKKAMTQFRAGDFDKAADHLQRASEVPTQNRVSAAEFAASLPENDYAFKPGGKAAATGKADDFVKTLETFSESIWETASTLLQAKLAAVDGYAAAVLLLEKSLLAGTGDEDTFMVDRMRAVRKVLNLSSEIKQAFAGYKKLQEFQRRLALCGIGQKTRPERIGVAMNRINEWKKSREQWYEAAEKAAPQLTFNSGPDERENFAQNQNRLEMFEFEFRLLWELASGFNREIASLIRGHGWTLSPLYGELLFGAVDFYLFCPDNFDSRLEYYRSLEDFFDAAGGGNLSKLLGGKSEAALWEELGKEDNIPHKTKPEVYRLLPALWSAGGLDCGAKPDVEAWEKVVDFYHADMERYIDENKPLRTEFFRTGSLLSAAERADPKQAMLIRRKLSLLWFHNYYQERYIGNALVEYLVRFALFHLADVPVSGEQRTKTAEKLDSVAGGFSDVWMRADKEFSSLQEEAEAATHGGAGRESAIKVSVLYTPLIYPVNVNAHITAARKSVKGSGSGGVKYLRKISSTGVDSTVFNNPFSVIYDGKGRLHIVLHGSSKVVTLDSEGNYAGWFGGYGSAPGRLMGPAGITETMDGNLLVSQVGNPSLSLFSPDGRFIKRFYLENDKERLPYRLAYDSSERLYVSFMDGIGISVYDSAGKFIKNIEAGKGALSEVKTVKGFCILDDKLVAAGNSKFIITDLAGSELQSGSAVNCDFGLIDCIAAGGNGKIYATDFKNAALLETDIGLKKIVKVENVFTVGISAVTEREGRLAVSDINGNSVQLFEL